MLALLNDVLVDAVKYVSVVKGKLLEWLEHSTIFPHNNGDWASVIEIFIIITIFQNMIHLYSTVQVLF